MHPPFGFALFYLRSVAARVPYLDTSPARRSQPVTHRADLLGRRALRLHPGHHGRPASSPSRRWSCTTRARWCDPGDVKIVLPPMGGQQLAGLGLPRLAAASAAWRAAAARCRPARPQPASPRRQPTQPRQRPQRSRRASTDRTGRHAAILILSKAKTPELRSGAFRFSLVPSVRACRCAAGSS